ncbi:MAG: hypothetical protein COY53_07720 [Elusimicrobia bacterium CG_4_10_14_0_8_um_filter_37_32]|nr:MAG: hypothetical protein COS17_03120 [Elusimicrobia bacterium CG02_land_8_20_14_3_00_37_13]PIZ12856.1 MAG: hypothetical protein COY53_07720 [Elusimicrobia bacterium CG_4_10_14_0_8_um_filter_37_32]
MKKMNWHPGRFFCRVKCQDLTPLGLLWDLFRRIFLFNAALVKNNYQNSQGKNQEKPHHNIVSHHSSLSIIKAMIKNVSARKIPKIILGKSAKVGEISKPKTWVKIINLPTSSNIRESFSCCLLVSFTNHIIQQTDIFVKYFKSPEKPIRGWVCLTPILLII